MFVFGILAGLVVTTTALVYVFHLVNKATHKEGTKTEYDERQLAARGKAYEYGFITMMILSAAAMCWFRYGGKSTSGVSASAVFWGIILAGGLVFASTAIWNDAYVGYNEQFRGALILTGLVGVINLLMGITSIMTDGLLEAYVNLGLGIMMTVVFIELIAKNLFDRYSADRDEE